MEIKCIPPELFLWKESFDEDGEVFLVKLSVKAENGFAIYTHSNPEVSFYIRAGEAIPENDPWRKYKAFLTLKDLFEYRQKMLTKQIKHFTERINHVINILNKKVIIG